ncbi:MAG: hypothetical protein ACREOF_14625 [Gemmatimonadales bacterium]
MKISIELTGSQQQQLAAAAQRLNVPAELLAAAAVRDLVAQPAPEFEQVAQRVLEKNRELYERLG